MSGDGYYAISLNAPPRCLGTPHKHGTALARIGRGVVVDPFGPLCTISNVRVAVVDVSSLSPCSHAHVAEAVVANHGVGVALNQSALSCLLLGS